MNRALRARIKMFSKHRASVRIYICVYIHGRESIENGKIIYWDNRDAVTFYVFCSYILTIKIFNNFINNKNL